MRARAVLDQFIELETQLASVLRDRAEARFEAHGKALERAAASGDLTEVEQTLNEQKAFSDRETRRMELLMLACLRLGADSVSERPNRRWTNPRGARADLLANSVALLQQLDHDYVRLEVSGAVVGDIAEQLGDDVLRKDENGKPKPKRRKDLVPKDFGYTPLLKPPDWGKAREAGRMGALAATEFAANLTTSRLVNYGALESMLVENIGIYRIKAILDNRTSRICRTMNGRVFEVRDGIQLLERALGVTDPAQLKSIHPWMPSNNQALAEMAAMNAPSLKERGYLVPPFHPRCRSVVVRAGGRKKSTQFKGVFNSWMLQELNRQATLEELATTPLDKLHLLDSFSLEMIIEAKNNGQAVPDDLYRAAGLEMGLRDLM